VPISYKILLHQNHQQIGNINFGAVPFVIFFVFIVPLIYPISFYKLAPLPYHKTPFSTNYLPVVL